MTPKPAQEDTSPTSGRFQPFDETKYIITYQDGGPDPNDPEQPAIVWHTHASNAEEEASTIFFPTLAAARKKRDLLQQMYPEYNYRIYKLSERP